MILIDTYSLVNKRYKLHKIFTLFMYFNKGGDHLLIIAFVIKMMLLLMCHISENKERT